MALAQKLLVPQPAATCLRLQRDACYQLLRLIGDPAVALIDEIRRAAAVLLQVAVRIIDIKPFVEMQRHIAAIVSRDGSNSGRWTEASQIRDGESLLVYTGNYLVDAGRRMDVIVIAGKRAIGRAAARQAEINRLPDAGPSCSVVCQP